MKKSQGNMYPGVKTWNPLGGECPHKCGYCSTGTLKRFPVIKYKYSGELRLFSDLHKDLKGKPEIIFVCAQNDLFAKTVPETYIKRILDKCNLWSQHTYFFQTKNPERLWEFKEQFPKDTILCTTIETNRRYDVMGNTPPVFDRAYAMSKLVLFTKHVTIEPIMRFNLANLVRLIKISGATKINIGADSKHNHLPEPNKDELLALIDELKKLTTIDQ